ncbi:hypothetical protein MHY85_10485 [Cellulomonas sp. ACRRI]|uniref:hypothetical protein n=1 Tax=Cellulomonas sp. ACRRI TaxID=2918188 RepID=UPI001EF177E3|nr:hypothetical protein [Cellulomonas sp. ACRRI]MCG7286395.1 hypothetical protein [Cellulomonas sp. ACRRI]
MSDEQPSGETFTQRQERDARVALRRRLLEVDPSSVRDDLDAAAECECGCHPRPGNDVHHGALCPCQLTDAERRELADRATRAFEAEQEAWAPVREAHARALASQADALGVDAVEEVPGAPLVISGTVDGVGFTMRERWDKYTIAVRKPVVDERDEADDSWDVITRGASVDLYPQGQVDLGHALWFTVAAIRSHLRRVTCTHPVRGRVRYCPRCGAALIDPALGEPGPPRWGAR